MPSPKFDAIQIQFSRKIGDPVSTAATAGAFASVAVRNAYVNLALEEVFRKYWEGVMGNSEAFLEIFPELHKSIQKTTSAGGTYTLAATDTFDFFKIIDAYTVSTPKYIKFLKKHLRTVVITGVSSLYTPSTDHFIGFEIEGVLEFYPASSFNAQNVRINYIRKPVDPSSGAAFSNGGTNDIPFNSIWSEEIAETAYLIWKRNQQEGR